MKYYCARNRQTDRPNRVCYSRVQSMKWKGTRFMTNCYLWCDMLCINDSSYFRSFPYQMINCLYFRHNEDERRYYFVLVWLLWLLWSVRHEYRFMYGLVFIYLFFYFNFFYQNGSIQQMKSVEGRTHEGNEWRGVTILLRTGRQEHPTLIHTPTHP